MQPSRAAGPEFAVAVGAKATSPRAEFKHEATRIRKTCIRGVRVESGALPNHAYAAYKKTNDVATELAQSFITGASRRGTLLHAGGSKVGAKAS